MRSIVKDKRDWEELAGVDPVGAIVGVSNRQGPFFDWDDFFRSGDQEIAAVLLRAADLGWNGRRDTALDFGCGLGKLSRAMARSFRHVYGLDISERMVAQAQELSADGNRCEFLTNPRPDLSIFPDDIMDFVYCRLVLQHVSTRALIAGYIREFIRVLKPGGLLVFQLPGHIPLLRRIQPRRRLYAVMRSLGFGPSVLYRWFRLAPGFNNFVPEKEVTRLLREGGVALLTVDREMVRAGVLSVTYYAVKSNQ